MVISLRKIWTDLPNIVRATLLAAWLASKIGAISLTAIFTITSLVFGIYAAAEGRAKITELLGIPAGGAVVMMLSLLISLFITLPVSVVIVTCAYPFLRALRTADQRSFGAIGFLVGILIWSALWWTKPVENLYFGSWLSVFVIGGVSGYAGGYAFAQQFNRGRQRTSVVRLDEM